MKRILKQKWAQWTRNYDWHGYFWNCVALDMNPTEQLLSHMVVAERGVDTPSQVKIGQEWGSGEGVKNQKIRKLREKCKKWGFWWVGMKNWAKIRHFWWFHLIFAENSNNPWKFLHLMLAEIDVHMFQYFTGVHICAEQNFRTYVCGWNLKKY